MNLCKVCSKPSMVMSGDYSKKVPFNKASDAKVFTCGLCVAYGYLKPETKQPDEMYFDLKEWRKDKRLTQKSLAELLRVSQPMVAMVERGEKVMPAEWGKTLGSAEI